MIIFKKHFISTTFLIIAFVILSFSFIPKIILLTVETYTLFELSFIIYLIIMKFMRDDTGETIQTGVTNGSSENSEVIVTSETNKDH